MSAPLATIGIVAAFLGGCACMERVHEEPLGSNDGPVIRRIQRATGNRPPDAWCASSMADVGVRVLGTRWPLPHTASCAELGVYAITHQAFYTCSAAVYDDIQAHGIIDADGKRLLPPGLLGAKARVVVAAPEPGDLCLLWSARLTRFHHVGVVREVVSPTTFRTWEGNTVDESAHDQSEKAQREGVGFYARTRSTGSPWGLVRWAALVAP